MKQVSGGATIVYVYDASGNLAAEYSTAAAQSACGTPTCYVSVDHLGSTRLVTDSAGNVTQRYDYLPFGEEIPAGLGGRTTTMGYEANPAGAPDGFNPKFTGQVRDVESGLDYFNARYYSPEQGRFVSADPGNAGSDRSDPQTWNGYAYVGGNPLALTDPSGESWLSWLGIGLDILGALIGDPALGIGVDLGLSASAAVTTSQVLLTAGSTLAGVGIMGGAPAGGLGGMNGINDGPWNEQLPIGVGGQGGIWGGQPPASGGPSGIGGCDFGVCGQNGNQYTANVGVAWSYTLPWSGIGVTFFAGFIVDQHGHFALYHGRGAGAAVGTGFSGGVQGSVSNADTVCGFAGPFDNVSGTGGADGAAATVDVYQGAGNGPGGVVTGAGATLGVGGGASASAYHTWTTVKTVGKKFSCPK
jgi:RHS repeat-associated protein